MLGVVVLGLIVGFGVVYAYRVFPRRGEQVLPKPSFPTFPSSAQPVPKPPQQTVPQPEQTTPPYRDVPLSDETVNYTGPIPEIPKELTCEEYMAKNYGTNWREHFRNKIENYPWKTEKGKENALTILRNMCKHHLWNLSLVSLENLAQIDRAALYDQVYKEMLDLKYELDEAIRRLENQSMFNVTREVAESMAADVIARAKRAGFGPCIFAWEYQGLSMPSWQPLYQEMLRKYWPDGNFEQCQQNDFFKDVERVTLERWKAIT
ncbi:MAG: hypothetical protein NZ821_07670 [Gloeomargarita sp. SKYB31]|nr:hypothetical protein [Gloeomargarita sp. SKYB31]